MNNFSRLVQHIKQYRNGRQLLIWGAWQRGQQLEEVCRENAIPVYGYIDSAKHGQQYHGLPVFDSRVINKEKYYIAVSLVEHASVFAVLEQNNYEEWEDYVYPNQVITLLRSRNSFEDKMGNSIGGFLSADKEKSYVRLSGASTLELGRNVHIGEGVAIVLEWNSHIKIGNNVTIAAGCTISCRENSEIVIGDNSTLHKDTVIHVMGNCRMEMGKCGVIGKNTHIALKNENSLHIGDDLLGAAHVKIRSGNGHAIMDLKNKQVHPSKKDVYIGEHTWLCLGSTILSGARVGAHSIIGAESLVNQEFPAHVMLAGNPAQVIREQVDWCMDESTTWEAYLELHNTEGGI